MAHRLAAMPADRFAVNAYRRARESCGDEFAPAFHWDIYEREYERLRAARRPRRVFVGSMGDMCFEGDALCFGGATSTISSGGIQAATSGFAHGMEQAGHTVLLLTKRPNLLTGGVSWPQNLHLGVSLTDNASRWRVEELLANMRNAAMLRWGTRPGKLWASVEPLLGDLDPEALLGLDWVVVGLLSGTDVRNYSMAYETWLPRLLRIRDWCRDHGMHLFCKGSVQRAFPMEEWPQQYPVIAGRNA